MSLTRTKFGISTRTQAWNIIIPYLRRSGALQPVKTWFVQEGEEKKMRDVTYGDCPALVIRPDMSGDTHWIDEISHKTEVHFVHELYMPGIKATDFMDFWGAVENTWFDGTNGLLVLLESNSNALRIWQKTVTNPPPPIIKDSGGLIQHSTGIVTLFMDITTGE